MFVLPVGLGTRLRQHPKVTTCVVVAWIAVGLVQGGQEETLNQAWLEAARDCGWVPAQRALFVEYCLARGRPRERCDALTSLVEPELHLALEVGPQGTRGKMLAEPKILHEQEVVEKTRRSLLSCGGDRDCFDEREVVHGFERALEKASPSLRRLRGWTAFATVRRKYLHTLQDACRKQHCLMQGAESPASLVLAQLRHSGLPHLFGNALVFVLFGMFVEQRIHPLLYTILLLVGGCLGMMTSLQWEMGATHMLLGGSAMVSVALGLFYSLFFRNRMRVLCFIPFKLAQLSAPVRYTLPLLIVLGDVKGIVDTGYAELSTGSVAHLAHVAGFLFGCLSGYVIRLLQPLPEGFLYPGERADLREAREEKSELARLDRVEHMAKVNPGNMAALSVGLETASNRIATLPPEGEAKIFERMEKFIEKYGPPYATALCGSGNFHNPLALVRRLPESIPLPRILGDLGHATVLRLADEALARQDVFVALRLYDHFLTVFHNSAKAVQVGETVKRVFEALGPLPENRETVNRFLNLRPHPALQRLAESWQHRFLLPRISP